MPISIPPFSQYQAPLVPVRGLWNARPKEGDKIINAEVDWSPATKGNVQFQLSGNSPVALTQIVAIYCDNADCGSDVRFLFPDTGFSLIVPANEQSLFPVLTNSLSFFMIALDGIGGGDRTVIQILNSMPPPIPLSPSSAAIAAQASGTNLAAILSNAVVIPATVSGTLKSLSINGWAQASAAGQQAVVTFQDSVQTLFVASIGAPNGGVANFDMTPVINARFVNGLFFSVILTTLAAGRISFTAYYSTP